MPAQEKGDNVGRDLYTPDVDNPTKNGAIKMNDLSGLVIKEPWIDMILAGKKNWEIRGSSTKRRGLIALIKSGSGMVQGTAEIRCVHGPFTKDELRKHSARHQVQDARIDKIGYRHIYAWEISNAKPLTQPVAYTHPQGAVIWVKFHKKQEFLDIINAQQTCDIAPARARKK